MRKIWIFILILAISCQLSAVSGLVSGCELWAMNNEQSAQGSQPIVHSSMTVDRCPLSVDYFESQIRLADSLYKNYLPQHNFEEVKAAMEFFERERETGTGFLRAEDGSGNEDGNGIFGNRNGNRNKIPVPKPRTRPQTSSPNSVPESHTLLCAKAHYYHAVGLTERDDIVGACEHYLRAMEIMEPHVETSPLWRLMAKDKRLKSKGKENAHGSQLEAHSSDYEKRKFVAMINMRLGELMYNNHLFDMAITTFLESLKHVREINDHEFESIILKYIGNTYYVSDNIDSALNCYYESLKTSDNQGNYIDIQKCLALILYEKGDKDSAYHILKDNIRKIDNQIVHDAYCYTLGEMFYHDKVYDSSVYYLERSIESEVYYIRFASAKILYSLYDSINDISNKNHYSDIYINYSDNEINNSIKKDSLQKIYNEYLTRKHTNHETILRKIYISTFSPVLITVILISLYLFFLLKKENKEKDSVINDLRFKYSIIKGKIKNKNEELKKKDEIINSKDLELSETKEKIQYTERATDINTFYESDICKRILLQNNNRILPLCDNDITLLLTSADIHLNNFTVRICQSFPNLKKGDLVYLCLILLRQDNYKITLLLSKNRKTVWERMKKIKERMCIEEDTDIRDIISAFLQ